MGGAIAQELALRRPDRARSIVVTASWARLPAFNAKVFEGWLIVEDESAEAEIDPDGVTTTDEVYLGKQIVPLNARSS